MSKEQLSLSDALEKTGWTCPHCGRSFPGPWYARCPACRKRIYERVEQGEGAGAGTGRLQARAGAGDDAAQEG